jgi:UDP-N-acetylmuramoylalanine--D-glutamate ligase
MTRPVLVVGVGINNRPLLRYFRERGVAVVAADRTPADRFAGPRDADVWWCLGPDYLEQACRLAPFSEVYLTPGMVKNQPGVEALVDADTRLTCETDLFLRSCPAPVIGITGSAGKTTTTTLLGAILRRDGGRPVHVGGNIGESLLPALPRIDPDSWVVMELSSFQLELTTVSPHGAAVLNLAPNHLDVHPSYEAYAEAKSHIFQHQSPSDWLVLPEPPPPLMEQALERHVGRRLSFQLGEPVARGAYARDGYIRWAGGGAERIVMPIAEWRLPGRMNLLNACAATAMALSAGARIEAVRDAMADFEGVPHRLELVREMDGIRFINDSIATAPDRTLAALEAVDGPLLVILGGYDKHLDYTELGQALRGRVRVAIVMGQTGPAIARAIGQGPPVLEAGSLKEAVTLARNHARSGDTVLLSPASASYDMFRNFEERGEQFRTLVHDL